MKPLLYLAAATTLIAAPADFYSSRTIETTGDKLLAKGDPFASAELARYGNHYTMLATRNRTGSAEVHQHEADIFVMEKGSATLLIGGKVVNPHAEKPGEIRGSSLEGAERHPVSVGDVIHIPAGEPHQMILQSGKPISYFVVKVTGQ